LPLVLILLLVGCKKKQKKVPPPVASPLAAATSEGASFVAGSPPTPKQAVPAAPVDPLSPSERAAADQAQAANRDLDSLVKRGILTDPDKPSEGDVVMKCASLDAIRARLEPLTDPDTQKLVAESRRLCSLEVPLLNANQTLRQVAISPSQASRRLMCGFASKDLERARASKPNDLRVRQLDMRYAQACK
jgi:hypothetical protein